MLPRREVYATTLTDVKQKYNRSLLLDEVGVRPAAPGEGVLAFPKIGDEGEGRGAGDVHIDRLGGIARAQRDAVLSAVRLPVDEDLEADRAHDVAPLARLVVDADRGPQAREPALELVDELRVSVDAEPLPVGLAVEAQRVSHDVGV